MKKKRNLYTDAVNHSDCACNDIGVAQHGGRMGMGHGFGWHGPMGHGWDHGGHWNHYGGYWGSRLVETWMEMLSWESLVAMVHSLLVVIGKHT